MPKRDRDRARTGGRLKNPIVIIGAGLSGLSAALEIEAAGESCLIIDENQHIGGKLESTVFDDAYILDRGFQVLLPAYPELQRLGNLEHELDLKYFASGARLEQQNGPLLMGDPRRHPKEFASTALGDYASFHDKFLVLKLQLLVTSASAEALLQSRKDSTLEFLRGYGFTEHFITSFWKPFFSGIFLEKDLSTSAGFFLYLVKMFLSSPVAVPAKGVGELPKLMASRLKKSEIRLGYRVNQVSEYSLELSSGEKIAASAVITETGGSTRAQDHGPFGSVTSFWFSASEAPYSGAWLSLNSNPNAPSINHVAVMSNVSPDYAMKGDALVSVNSLDAARISETDILKDAETLFGATVKTWKLLRRDDIDRAFPLYLGRTDYNTPSQQGSLERGRKSAAAALSQL